MIAEFHELLPVCEVRAQTAESTAVNAELAFETADEDVMVDGQVDAAERSRPTNTVAFFSSAAEQSSETQAGGASV